MKKYLILSMSCVFLFSCSLENEKEKMNESSEYSMHNQGKSLVYDNMYEVKEGKVYELSDISSTYSALTTRVNNENIYKFEKFSTVAARDLFLGHTFSASFFNKEYGMKPLGFLNDKNMIKASVSTSKENHMINADRISTRNLIQNVKEEQILSSKSHYKYFVKKINTRDNFNVFFGYKVNIDNLFGVDISKEVGTIALVELVQEYYSVNLITDANWNIFKTPEVLQGFLNETPIYINSIDYGRRTFVLLRSQKFSYEELLFALRELNEISDSNSYSQLTKDVLKGEPIASILMFGGSGDPNIQLGRLDGFFKDFKRPVLGLGVPIYFKANYAQTNKPFVSVISVE